MSSIQKRVQVKPTFFQIFNLFKTFLPFNSEQKFRSLVLGFESILYTLLMYVLLYCCTCISLLFTSSGSRYMIRWMGNFCIDHEWCIGKITFYGHFKQLIKSKQIAEQEHSSKTFSVALKCENFEKF